MLIHQTRLSRAARRLVSLETRRDFVWPIVAISSMSSNFSSYRPVCAAFATLSLGLLGDRRVGVARRRTARSPVDRGANERLDVVRRAGAGFAVPPRSSRRRARAPKGAQRRGVRLRRRSFPISQCAALSQAPHARRDPAPAPSVLALETVPSLRARAAANASTPSGGMSRASAALYRRSAGHRSNPSVSIIDSVVPGRARAGARLRVDVANGGRERAPRVCSSRICCASALSRRSFFSATACATSAAFPGRDLRSPLHPFPVTAANPPHAAATYRRRRAGRQAARAAATPRS